MTDQRVVLLTVFPVASLATRRSKVNKEKLANQVLFATPVRQTFFQKLMRASKTDI